MNEKRRKLAKWPERIFNSLFVFLGANIYALRAMDYHWFTLILSFIVGVIVVQIIPSTVCNRYQTKKLRHTGMGAELLIAFLGSCVLSGILAILGFTGHLEGVTSEWKFWVINTCIVVLVEAVCFWNGMIRIFLYSSQLGMKWRGIGIACGMIPLVHLYVLGRMILITAREAAFENDRLLLDESRAEEQICATKYPILLVHGVFFRDSRYLNYWGRIPQALEKNGAKIYYGNHQSALSVADSAEELKQRMEEIRKETGAEKLNIIAHSKGGLDCRYAISCLGAGDYAASLTTINTPHRGCEFAQYLLEKAPQKLKDTVSSTYNATMKKLGDANPDFLKAVEDLTAENCRALNEKAPDQPGVFYQSTGSKLKKPTGGRFPLNLTNRFVKMFDGNNDGLVGEKSFAWGSHYEFLTAKGKRGISHGDMIDLNRENFRGFDVREFYVQLVAGLKEQGL